MSFLIVCNVASYVATKDENLNTKSCANQHMNNTQLEQGHNSMHFGIQEAVGGRQENLQGGHLTLDVFVVCFEHLYHPPI